MARRIIDSGCPTTLWARRPTSLDPYRDSSAVVATTPAELAAASDVVCVCVVNDRDVHQVFESMLPGIAPNAIIAIQSTVHPDTCRRLAAMAAERDAIVIDAPVSGGGAAAVAGELLVMVGGDAGPVQRARPVFETYGNPVIHVGPLGSGQLAKLVNNVVFAAQVALADDALHLGEGLGLDRARLAEVVAHGSGNSHAFAVTAAMGLRAMARVGAPLLRKDVDIVAAVAQELDAPVGSLVDVADAGIRRMTG